MPTNSKSTPQKRKKQRDELQKETLNKDDALNSEDNDVAFVDEPVDVASTISRARRSRT